MYRVCSPYRRFVLLHAGEVEQSMIVRKFADPGFNPESCVQEG